ncbi:hypothetical protein [Hydrogenophaga sp.]|uniref:hypothetical protein n=1 Tax=Hydrogenophaga sp. TaxID=1904254 RepID=UPI0027174976|nr:hypothetical protein [Hydrogenophaga sp.]MDO9439179.1 hypothetical protein [Hydrogenophaga sp.]
MSEAIQKRRRTNRARRLLAGFAITAVLAMALAIATEALVSLTGLALGDGNWHRGWVESRLTKSPAWLEGAPLVGALLSGLVDPRQGWLPAEGAWRDIVVLALVLFVPCLWVGRHVAPVLVASYDEEALRPTPPIGMGLQWAGPLGATQQAAWAELSAWCSSGIGEGHTPFWRPWMLPDVAERFSLCVMVGENGGGKSHLAESFARSLDHHDALAAFAAGSRSKAWRFKLLVKWRELWWWQKRHPRQPWDCGYLVEDPAALVQLSHFRPRRPTLMIADELSGHSLEEALRALIAARVDYRHPVRLLVIDVAPPSVLALRRDHETELWKTAVNDLGVVHYIGFTDARFQATQLRALVGAQPLADGKHQHLMGKDDEWAPVTKALQEQPILVAEAVRWVREQERRYEDLLPATELAQAMVDSQARRSATELPADALGKRRELLRERILRDRARHRETALHEAVGADDAAYHALMVASVAGGASSARLSALHGFVVNPLTSQRLEAAFGAQLPDGWVPPVKPAVVADEMLRLHLGVPFGSDLAPHTRERLRILLRQAWLLNPHGARNTVMRWQRDRRPDAFAKAMLELPSLADLHDNLEPRLRADLVRAFVELAVLHHGDLAQARAALDLLRPEECRRERVALESVLLHASAAGLSALVLWLDLQRLSFPDEGELSAESAHALAIRLAVQVLQLLRQSTRVSEPVDAVLESVLDEAAFAALPLLARLGPALAADAELGSLVMELDRRVIGLQSMPNPVTRLRLQVRRGLLAALEQAKNGAEPAQTWAAWLLSASGRMDPGAATPTLDDLWSHHQRDGAGVDRRNGLPPPLLARAVSLWLTSQPTAQTMLAIDVQRLEDFANAFGHDVEAQFAVASAWRHYCFLHRNADAMGVSMAAQRVADIAARFPQHEDLQRAAAEAWRHLAWAHKDDVHATAPVAQKVAAIAAAFPQNEGIQQEAAQAWRYLSWAHKDIDAQATEQAAQKVADIAARFPQHEDIQRDAAEAWRNVCWLHRETGAPFIERLAPTVMEIAARFPRHAEIQSQAAQVWCTWASANHNNDPEGTVKAAQKVADIAARFAWHERIQLIATQAWRMSSWAFKDSDVEATQQAAQRVAAIANRFPQHEDMQFEAAAAWGNVCWSCEDTDAPITARTAQRVADIAARFPHHENMQRTAAQAWRTLSWAHKDTDAQATAQAAQKVVDIAARFPGHEGIQHEAAQAWRFLTWAHKSTDAQATAQAAQRVADIASRFAQHEDIQHEAAQAWHFLSLAHKNTDAQATAQSAQHVADIAARFVWHEPIQYESAQAWRHVAQAAVRFGDAQLVTLSSQALDKLVGKDPSREDWARRIQATSGRIMEERQLAQVAIQAWHAQRGMAG